MELSADYIPEKDTLNRKRFAKEISSNIINYLNHSTESLTIGIHGPWGSGKSSLLSFIIDEIKIKKPTKCEFHIFEFNPWIFSGKPDLQSVFLNELSIKISSKKNKLRKAIKLFSGKLDWVDDVSKIGSAAKKTIEKWADVSIEQLKEETNKILLEEQIKILIIMDDIDRLSPREILEVFQLIKLNANFRNTIFLISFDKSVVRDSIKQQYNFDGEKYLEKIIQVDYSLPSIMPEDIESMFYERLESLLNRCEIDFDIKGINTAWLIKGLKFYFGNIRDLNRYFNGLNFRLPSFHKNVNIRDFLVLEAIRLFDYESYEVILNNYREMIQFGNDTSFKREMDKLYGSHAGTLFNYLCENKNSKKEERIYTVADPVFFDRYFSLSVSKRDLLEEEFEHFLKFPEMRMQKLDSIISNGKTEFFLRRISTKSLLSNQVDKTNLISCLIRVWGKHQEEFARNWRNVWDAVKTIISEYQDENVGLGVLIDDLNSSSSDFNPAQLVFMWFLLENINKEHDNTDKDLLASYDLLKSKEQRIISSFKLLLQNYQTYFFFGNSQNVLYTRIFIPSYAKYHPDSYKDQAKQFIADDNRLFLILNIFVVRDSESRTPFAFDPKYLEVLLPGELKTEFENRLKAINLKTLAKEDAKAVEGYLNYTEKTEAFQKQQKILVLSATYEWPDGQENVTDQVKALIGKGVQTLIVDPSTFGIPDPAIGVLKTLKLHCKINGVEKEFSHTDGERFHVT